MNENIYNTLQEMTEDDKRQMIIERYDTSFFVEAGAGAGKTSLIVSRVFNQLLHGVSPDNIVVITFTNMATEEVKARIERKIYENRDKFPEGELPDVDSMQISTIHSFCARLLNEQVFRAKLPIEKKVIEESEKIEIADRLFDEYQKQLDSHYRTALYGTNMGHNACLTSIKKFYTIMCNYPDYFELKINNADVSDSREERDSAMQDLIESFYGVYSSMDAEQKGMVERRNKLTLANIKDIFDDKGGLKCDDSVDKRKVLISIEKNAKSEGKASQFYFFKSDKTKTWEGIFTELDKALKAWYDKNKTAIENLIYYDQILICRLAREARKYYIEHRPKDKVSNNMLIEEAEKLVRESEEAREYFAGRYKYIYVDEFQDTNRLQTSLIMELGKNAVLFLVGDPKQSIYRFTGAEPEEYYRIKKIMKERMEAGEKVAVVSLSYNFRSGKDIVTWVNDNFKDKDMLDDDVEYIPMEARKPELESVPDASIEGNAGKPDDKLISGVYTCKIPEGLPEKYNELEDRKRVADIVCALTDPNLGYRITDYRDDVAYTRAINCSDILILCPDTNKMSIYYDELAARGIPVKMSGKTNLGDNYVARLYLRLCRYLSDVYHQGNRLSVEEAYRGCNVDSDSIDSILEYLVQETTEMSAYGIANYLVENICWVPDRVGMREKYIYKLIQIKEKAFALSERNGEDLIDLMDQIAGSNFTRVLTGNDDGESVRFMNMHKSKGLEGNIVIFTARTGSKNRTENGFGFEGVYYPSLKVATNKYWTPDQEEFQELEVKVRTADAKEQIRREYVVATRAKQAFILMDTLNTSDPYFDDSYHVDKDIYHVIEDKAGLKYSAESAPICGDGDNAADSSENNRFRGMTKVRLKPVNTEPLYVAKSPSGYEGSSKTRSVAKTEWDRIGGKKSDLESRRPSGNILGTVMHRAFELLVSRLWDRSDRDDMDKFADKIPCFVNQAIAESYEDIDRAGKSLESDSEAGTTGTTDIVIQYQEFLNAALERFWKWLLESGKLMSADNVYTELPFSFFTKNDDTEDLDMTDKTNKSDIWLNGEMDLLIHYTDGSMLLIDYKSDTDYFMDEATLETSLVERYKGQIVKYKESVSRLFDTAAENITAGIVSFTQKGIESGVNIRYTEIR